MSGQRDKQPGAWWAGIEIMPILIFVTIIGILYVMVAEPEQEKKRHIVYQWLAVAALVGLAVSFGILVYLVARYTPIDGAYPGSGDLSKEGTLVGNRSVDRHIFT